MGLGNDMNMAEEITIVRRELQKIANHIEMIEVIFAGLFMAALTFTLFLVIVRGFR